MPARSGPPVVKVGIASTDWSATMRDPYGGRVPGGANWVRLGQVKGISVNNLTFGDLIQGSGKLGVQSFDRRGHFDCEAIIMQRYMHAWVPAAITNARLVGQTIINDLDDWFWGLHAENTASKAVDPKANPKVNLDHYRRSLEASSLVTVSTPFLADALAQWGIRTAVIENRLMPWAFRARPHRSGTPVVGWTGSTAHRSADLPVVAEALRKVRKKVRFHHTGDHDTHPSFASQVGLDRSEVTTLPLMSPVDYAMHGFPFDIGIVPLNDVTFNLAKSWIKGIEYAACGIPFIASDIGEYQRLHRKFGIGRLASTTEEWVEHLTELCDPEVRAAEGRRLREVIAAEFDVKSMAKQWDRAIWEARG